ncbi:calmodulin [Agrobacterium rhizogenes]|nr:calmodulin [Rhizobium rhizogenes]NTJ80688.1 calmodulin [Rhizobium rhizogenes]
MARYFEFETSPYDAKFVFELTDETKIAHVLKILSGEEKDKVHVIGRIKVGRKSYNPNLDFYMDPDSIDFFEVSIEVCDATTNYVNDHLDEAGGAFLPGYVWCPWSSKVTREVTP